MNDVVSFKQVVSELVRSIGKQYLERYTEA